MSATQRTNQLIKRVPLGDVPIVVVLIAAVSGWMAYVGITPRTYTSGALINPVQYTITLFTHEGWSQYVASMYFFVPGGIALTYITTNKNALGVIAASHICAVLSCGAWLDMAVFGTTAAAYGLLAATIVAAVHVYTDDYSEKVQVGVPIAVLIVSAFALAAVTQTSEHAQVLMGFVFGGSFQGIQVILSADIRAASSAEDKEEDFGFTHERR